MSKHNKRDPDKTKDLLVVISLAGVFALILCCLICLIISNLPEGLGWIATFAWIVSRASFYIAIILLIYLFLQSVFGLRGFHWGSMQWKTLFSSLALLGGSAALMALIEF